MKARTSSPFRAWGIHWLALGVGVFVLANGLNDLAGRPFWTITRLIRGGAENNIQSWYASLLLAIAALAAWRCYRLGRTVSLKRSWTFAAAAALLLFMSCDEIAAFHEKLGDLVASRLGIAEGFVQASPWVWTLGAVVVVLFVVASAALWRPLARVRRTGPIMVSGFATILLGGVVLESTISFLNHDELQWLWDLENISEETLEMVGTLLLLYAFARWGWVVQAESKSPSR